MAEGAEQKAKRLVLQYINGVSSNPVEGRTKNCQLKDLILTLFGLIFRRILIFSFNLVSQVTLRSSGTDILYGYHLLRCLHNIVLLRDVFHIGLVIGPRHQANTADRGPIARPILKTSRNDTFIN